MAGKVTFSIMDNSAEKSNVGFHVATLTSANIDPWIDDTPTGLLGQLRVLLSALTIGNHANRIVTALQLPDATVEPPADPYAQRERKAVVTMLDTITGKYFRNEIPAFGDSGVEAGTDLLDLDVAAWAAYVAFVEANCLSPAGNAFTVVRAKLVGRNI